jgi:DNA-binding PadR family transcriptional regulator
LSVRHGLLALLLEGPKYGYQLRAEFEMATGGSWPLNIGQVYTTLQRLERDGMVVGLEPVDGQRRYQLTALGFADLDRWLATPVPRQLSTHNELAVKVALAVGMQADVPRVLQVQRRATMALLQDLQRDRRQSGDDLAAALTLDALIFSAEAEIRWLDHCDQQLHQAQEARSSVGAHHHEEGIG